MMITRKQSKAEELHTITKCQVFFPTEEEFADFESCIQKYEKLAGTDGVFKVSKLKETKDLLVSRLYLHPPGLPVRAATVSSRTSRLKVTSSFPNPCGRPDRARGARQGWRLQVVLLRPKAA